jgi:hypothetical protein
MGPDAAVDYALQEFGGGEEIRSELEAVHGADAGDGDRQGP